MYNPFIYRCIYTSVSPFIYTYLHIVNTYLPNPSIHLSTHIRSLFLYLFSLPFLACFIFSLLPASPFSSVLSPPYSVPSHLVFHSPPPSFFPSCFISSLQISVLVFFTFFKKPIYRRALLELALSALCASSLQDIGPELKSGGAVCIHKRHSSTENNHYGLWTIFIDNYTY